MVGFWNNTNVIKKIYDSKFFRAFFVEKHFGEHLE